VQYLNVLEHKNAKSVLSHTEQAYYIFLPKRPVRFTASRAPPVRYILVPLEEYIRVREFLFKKGVVSRMTSS